MLKEMESWARKAGRLQMDNFQKNIEIDSKDRKIDLVTEVDKKSEKILVDKISTAYPDHSIMAEEGSNKSNDSRYCWIIDPLDGTVNYVHGFPIFAISLALYKDDQPEYGLVYLPYFDDFYVAQRGQGSYYNGKRIHVDEDYTVKDGIIATGFPYSHQESNESLELFNKILPEAGGIRRTGAAAYDLCQVASGVFSGFWEIELNLWDIAAGILLIEEAGGVITDFKGKTLRMDSEQVVAGNKQVNYRLREILNK
ncbi:inositol monophosphatase [Halanaerobiaceae bacterium Z-7014]|uniref:Inositol-1-monophosphatase n=1 Tax=Halonatronomonas betaini TaxID=2778430 RepID=A0A931F7V6_9FIRM|nr:inositol monophosphatase family protein [Halonatronomonas betaini]MBF8437081.1 inositol monophosphatase [Halonatronomonas betaini]